MQNHFKKFLSLGLITLFFTIFVSFSNVATGSLTDNISGFAWEANDWVDKNSNGLRDNVPPGNEDMSEPGGAGWISFNCTSDTSGTCASSDYGVNANPTTGYLTGYAWSSNYGWLKFGGLSGFPAGSGTTADNVKIDFTGGTANARPVTGWARFCAVYVSGCSGDLVSNALSGGWDGWVSFSGSPSYGVTLNTVNNEFSGYAWGGNSGAGNIGKNVVGWISFNCISGGNCGSSDYKVSYNPPGTPTVDITSTSLGGDIYRLSWTGQNLASGNSCTATQNGGGSSGWPGARPASGTFDTSALADGTYDFIITCNGASGGTAVDNVVVVVGADLDFQADSLTVYGPSCSTTLRWNSIPSGYSLTNCTPSSSPAVSAWNSLSPWNIPPIGSSSVVVPPNSNPTVFTLTCYDGVTPIVKSVTLNRDTAESVELTNSQVIGTSPNFSTTLTWTTINTNANSCVASLGNSSWLTPLNKPNQITGSDSQSNIVVPASGNLTYTITCIGQSGNPVTDSITLNSASGSSFITKPIYIEN